MIGQSIGVSGKTSGESISLQWTNSVALESTSVVKMPFGPDSVGSYEAKGEDLVINLKSGESVTVEGFFTLFDEGDELNELILQDESGVLWRAQLDPILGEFTFTEAASLDIATSSATGFAATVPGWLKIGLAALAIGGIAASKSSGGGSSKNEYTYDDGSAPQALTDLTINDEGTVITGRGQPGAEVIIKGPTGRVVGQGTVQGNGNFEVTLYEAQIDGERLVATQTDGTGKISPETSVTVPDSTEPGTLSLKIDDDGAAVTVIGEPGGYVVVKNALGAVVGAGTIDDSGTIDIILITPQVNGETLAATQTDPVGNISPEVTVVAPDTTPPLTPEIAISSSGTAVTVTGEPGAKVTITNQTGAVIGLDTVGDRGTVNVTLMIPQINGEKLTATQTDAAGNTSPKISVIAPGGAAPIAPVLDINAAGNVVTVRGVAGEKVMITTSEPSGAMIGLGVVGSSGIVNITLITPQINGQALTVTQTDAAGKISDKTTIIAPGGTAPGAAPILVIDDAGDVVKVTGEPGAKVVIKDPTGVNIGVGIIGSSGFVNITLLTPQTNGEKLTATQTDAAGNKSPESTVVAPDKTAPAAPELVIDSVGKVVTVTGEVGAIVTVFNPSGSPIGVGIIGPSGKVDITLVVSQPSGQKLTATQMDSAGNESPKGSANVPSGSKSKALFAEADDDSDTMMMGKAESGATVEAKDDTAMATGLASQYSSLSIDLSAVEEFSAIDEGQEFAALLVSLDDVLAIEDGQEFAPLPEQEEGQALTITSTDNFVVDVAGYDVQPVVDPLDNLLDQDNLYI